MTKMSWILIILLAFMSGMFEATFVTLLPAPWRDVRPVLDVIILLIVLYRPRGALVYAALAGFVIDAMSLDSGIFSFARLLVVAAAVWILSETIVTNRSVYATAALVVSGRMVDRLWKWMAQLVGKGLFRWDLHQEPLGSFVTTLVWDIGCVSFAFVCLALFTRRFLVTVARPSRFYEHR